MLPLLETTDSGIDIMNWVRRWLDILVEGEGRVGGWVFQHTGGERMNIHDLDEYFQEAIRYLQAGDVRLTPEGLKMV